MTFPLMSFYLITIEILRDYALYSKKIPGAFPGYVTSSGKLVKRLSCILTGT